jgi:hypothetical protein
MQKPLSWLGTSFASSRADYAWAPLKGFLAEIGYTLPAHPLLTDTIEKLFKINNLEQYPFNNSAVLSNINSAELRCTP